jgi:hypothetical protein
MKPRGIWLRMVRVPMETLWFGDRLRDTRLSALRAGAVLAELGIFREARPLPLLGQPECGVFYRVTARSDG